MPRVLVPLDGTDLAESIIPYARRLAGADGEIVLFRESLSIGAAPYAPVAADLWGRGGAPDYPESIAESLREEGVSVCVRHAALTDPAEAIDTAADIMGVDLIAMATHGRGPLHRLVTGGVAWRTLAHSPVPVLLRHVESPIPPLSDPMMTGKILVPLDGSPFAERALPLAASLAVAWNAPLWLVRIVQHERAEPHYSDDHLTVAALSRSMEVARHYLEGVSARLGGWPLIEVGIGPAVERLRDEVSRLGITDVVLSSHGRTGLSRAVLGSVADRLIHTLHCNVIVVPSGARLDEETESLVPPAEHAVPATF